MLFSRFLREVWVRWSEKKRKANVRYNTIICNSIQYKMSPPLVPPWWVLSSLKYTTKRMQPHMNYRNSKAEPQLKGFPIRKLINITSLAMERFSSLSGARHRMARPGPGKGWRHTLNSSMPSAIPNVRTSSYEWKEIDLINHCITHFSIFRTVHQFINDQTSKIINKNISQ